MTFLLRKSFLIIISVLFLIFSMWIFGHAQLGGFDMSALVDTGWRMANGQIPYADFPLTTPVAFYIGAGWAFQLFGVKWSSFVVIAIIFTAFSFLAQLYLLSTIMPWRPAWAISFVSHLLCSVVTSYWWYNSITMNAVCLFLSAAYLFANRPNKRVSSISLWATLTLLSLMKPNIAGGLAVLVFIALFVFSSYRSRLMIIGASALVAFFTILFLLKISPFDVIDSYLAIGKGRAAPSIKWFFNDKPYEHLVVLPIIFLSLLPMLERISRFYAGHNTPTMKINLAITLTSLLTGCLSLVTNSDSNLVVGIPFFLLSSTVFYFLTEPEIELPSPHKLWSYLASISIGFALVGSIIVQANYHAANAAPDWLAFWFIVAILCGVFSIFVLVERGDAKSNYLPQFGGSRERLVWATLLFCGGIALFAAGMRWRVSYIGSEMFFTYSPLTQVEDIPFAENFHVSPTAKLTLVEIQQVLKDSYGSQENWREAPIYFGPRIEFAYAAFGVLSPKNQPIWWHPNNSYPPESEPVYVQSFLQHHFTSAIFMKIPGQNIPDFLFLPHTIVADLLENYNRIDYSSIVVFHKK